MNRREFLDLLRYYLRSYPANIINDIVIDYEEHFRIGMENGKSEIEISKELGSPKDIADEFLAHEIPPRPNMNTNFIKPPYQEGSPMSQTPISSKQKSSWLIVLLFIAGLIIFGPVGLGLFVSFIGLLFSLFAVILALGVSGMISLFSWFHPLGRYVSFFGYNPHPVTSIFLGIFLLCLSILAGYLTFLFLVKCVKGVKNLYLSICWKLAKRRGQK